MKQSAVKAIPRILCAAICILLYLFMFSVVPSKPLSDFDFGMAYDTYCISAMVIQIPAGCLICGLIGGFAFGRFGVWSLGFAIVTLLAAVLSVLRFFPFYESMLWMFIYPAVVAVGYGIALLVKRLALGKKREDGTGFAWRWI